MLLAHSYAGWLIFLARVALFSGVLQRFLPRPIAEGHSEPREAASARSAGCTVCGRTLSHAISAGRRACGGFYHRACIDTSFCCPLCRRPTTTEGGSSPRGG